MSDDVDLISWLKAEMMDMLDKEFCETALGPAIFGEGNFDVQRNPNNGRWECVAKPEWNPEGPKGIELLREEDDVKQLYPKKETERKHNRDLMRRARHWRVHYNLAYDGGGTEFDQYYHTKVGAKISAFLHIHIRSWGGSAVLYDNWDG